MNNKHNSNKEIEKSLFVSTLTNISKGKVQVGDFVILKSEAFCDSKPKKVLGFDQNGKVFLDRESYAVGVNHHLLVSCNTTLRGSVILPAISGQNFSTFEAQLPTQFIKLCEYAEFTCWYSKSNKGFFVYNHNTDSVNYIDSTDTFDVEVEWFLEMQLIAAQQEALVKEESNALYLKEVEKAKLQDKVIKKVFFATFLGIFCFGTLLRFTA